MNLPPEDFVTIHEDRLLAFASACLEQAGLEAAHAALVSRLLVDSDLRGVRCHGTVDLNKYCRQPEENGLNPRPQVEVVHETATAVVINGDGALGHMPTVRATELAITKAKEVGIGMGLVRSTGLYGSAGHYTRMCMDNGCIGFSVQGPEGYADYESSPRNRRDRNRPNKPSLARFGWPPISFAMPSGEEPPVVLDAGTPTMAGYFDHPEFEQIIGQIPSAIFKGVGLGAVAGLLSGGLTGLTLPEARQLRERWSEAFRGSMGLAIHSGSGASEEVFRDASDHMVREVRELYEPVPGFDRALIPGAVEEEALELHRRDGIRYGLDEQAEAREVGERLGIPLPWVESGVPVVDDVAGKAFRSDLGPTGAGPVASTDGARRLALHSDSDNANRSPP